MANDFTDLGKTEEEDRTSGMSFFDHLEELRWRIVRSLLSVVVGTIIAWIFIDWLVDGVLLRPITVINAHASGSTQQIHLQNLKPFGQLFLYMQVAIVSGVIIVINACMIVAATPFLKTLYLSCEKLKPALLSAMTTFSVPGEVI